MGGAHGYQEEDECIIAGLSAGLTPLTHVCFEEPVLVRLVPPESASPKRLYMEDTIQMFEGQTVDYSPIHAVDLTGCWKRSGGTAFSTLIMTRTSTVGNPTLYPPADGQWYVHEVNGNTDPFQVNGFDLKKRRADGVIIKTGTISSDGASYTFGPNGTGTTLVYQHPGEC